MREVIYIAQGHRDGDASSGVLLQPLIQSLSLLSPLHPGAPAHEDPGPSQQPLRQDPAIMRGSPSCPEGSPPGNVPGWSAARAGARPWLFWHQLQVGYLHFKQPRHALQTLSVCGPQSSYAKRPSHGVAGTGGVTPSRGSLKKVHLSPHLSLPSKATSSPVVHLLTASPRPPALLPPPPPPARDSEAGSGHS